MIQTIDFEDIPSIPLLIKDYLKEKEDLKSFYSRSLSYSNLLEQAKEKLLNYKNREALITEITKQLKDLELTNKQKNNLEKLSLNNTVTITTGHQLNLMTGPLYFIYKILHTIKLCDSMNSQQQEYNFIPIFWMATEDHDFQEINHFKFQNELIEWQGEYTDFVGELSTTELKTVLSDFYTKLKYYPEGKKLRQIIEKSYFSKNNLAEATYTLVDELFKEYGLLIIDGNSSSLKQLFIPFIEDDIKNEKSFKHITSSIKKLETNYKIQVNPREINFFYRDNNKRNRIERQKDIYYILNTDKHFLQKEILDELYTNPEKFSPNALMRPVYQEVILPNVAYIGGNAEIAYWLELKQYFNSQNLTFPILIPRNSVLLLSNNQVERMDKYSWKITDLFKSKEELIQAIVEKHPGYKFNFEKYQTKLHNIFIELLEESKNTDPTWKDMIAAQEKKQLNGLEKINKRFYSAERKKNAELINNFNLLYTEIFPNDNWQERVNNFSDYYSIFGSLFFQHIYNQLDEFKSAMIISRIM